MGKKRAKAIPSAPPPEPATGDDASGLRGFVLRNAVGLVAGPLLRFVAAFPLGFAVLLLSAGWLVGPQRFVDAYRFRAYTAGASGRIVDSWLAIDFDAAAQGDRGNWAGPARATHCAVVAYDGEWGQPLRRAFCGNRLNVHGEETLPLLVDDTTMAPGIPFAMPRDERGFAAPEIRIGDTESAWLKTHPPFGSFGTDGASNAWDALRARLDRPLDAALAGWGVPRPEFPLSLDPRAPAEAMPSAYVAAKRDPGSGGAAPAGLMLLAAGAWLWLVGMRVLMAGLPDRAVLFAAAVPLLLLPWWGERMPRALARVQPQVAEIIGDMLADIDITGRLIASSPGAAQLAHGGQRLVWRVGEGADADTLGRIDWGAPPAGPATPQAALDALVSRVAARMAALTPAQRAQSFDRLASDKEAGRYGGALLFVPAAIDIAYARDGAGDADERRAAARFLDVWVTSPVEAPLPDDVGFAARVGIWRRLAEVPDATVANRARWIVEGARVEH